MHMQPPPLNADARILLVRPDRVGDVILSTSCIRSIHEAFPRGELYFFAAERMRPLLDGQPELDGFVSDPAAIPDLQLDTVVHLHPDAACYRAAWRARVPIRIGYRARGLNRCLTHAVADARKEGLRHEAMCNFDLLRLIGVEPPSQLRPNVHLPESSRISLQTKLPWPLDSTRFAVLNPSAHSKIARWPAQHFAQLAGWLQDVLGLHVVIIGEDATDSLTGLGGERMDLAGQTDLGELGWLLKYARVLVTRDTGPSHLAAAVDCPVVVLFGRTDPIHGPTRWRPLTDKAIIVAKSLPKKTFEGQEAHWRRCFAAISVGEVQQAVVQLL